MNPGAPVRFIRLGVRSRKPATASDIPPRPCWPTDCAPHGNGSPPTNHRGAGRKSSPPPIDEGHMAKLIPLQSTEAAANDDAHPVSVIIPLYNEQNILNENVETLARFFDTVVGHGRWYFLFVENGSTDSTAALADAAAARRPPSRVIHLPKPNYGIALKAGLQAATTKWVYVVDIEQWDFPFIAWSWKNRNAYDVLIASKRADYSICHQHFYRRILSCALNGLLQVFTQFSGTDTHGPKLLNRVSLQTIIDACALDRGQYDTELVLRAVRGQKRIIEAPSEYRE